MKLNLVRNELAYQLNEWGLSNERKSHVHFRHELCFMIEKLIGPSSALRLDAQLAKSTTFEMEDFPKNPLDAYRFILHLEMNADIPPHRLCVYSDKLGVVERYSLNPFTRRHYYNKQGKRQDTKYIRKKEYKGFLPEDFDPFRRFEFVQLSKKEFMYHRWVMSSRAAKAGIFFEAQVSCHVLQFQNCFQCKCRNSLRWNGGSESSWQDLKCAVCTSTYEIKTKRTNEKIEKCFNRNEIPGGSFAALCQQKNKLQPGQKMFIVLLPRLPQRRLNGEGYHPVYIAEIEHALPQIVPFTFERTEKPSQFPILKSLVSINLFTKQLWFELPSHVEIPDLEGVVKEVFAETFSSQQLHVYDEFFFAEGDFSSDDDEDNHQKNNKTFPVLEGEEPETGKLAIEDGLCADWDDESS